MANIQLLPALEQSHPHLQVLLADLSSFSSLLMADAAGRVRSLMEWVDSFFHRKLSHLQSQSDLWATLTVSVPLVVFANGTE
jgi:hypothetical protein